RPSTDAERPAQTASLKHSASSTRSPAGASSPQATDPDEAPLPRSSVRAAADAPPAETWSRLQSDDLAVFTANLRAAGLPDRQVRLLVNAEINDRFRAREEALRPPRTERKYWETRDS